MEGVEPTHSHEYQILSLAIITNIAKNISILLTLYPFCILFLASGLWGRDRMRRREPESVYANET